MNEIITDASTDPSRLTRKNNRVNDEEQARRKQERQKLARWRPLHGLVPCEEIYSSAEVAA